jgi:transcriptional regulator with XRE-family HTH domain
MGAMAEKSSREYPYKTLGSRLKVLREKFKESLAEVSGAVEIEIDTLSNFELGMEKPSEDILLLLISHFGVKEDEAARLWELANYEPHDSKESSSSKQGMLVATNDARVIYTDLVYVTGNQYGVVINFMQESGPQSQPLIVSRVGMSREHARSLLEVLKQTLEAAPKALPQPDQKLDAKKEEKTDRS